MITIRKPLNFSEIGRKDNQEDYLFPTKASEDTRIFIMCDGMGGHDNGEVASRTAANALGEFLTSCSQVDIPTFEAGLGKAYDALDAIDTNSPKKPGTTMTCLCLNDDSYIVAHIGDSRIYHIRPSLYNPETKRGGILYQSSDHSLVNELLKAGEITEEEARDFPQKNVITRAMQPHLAKRYKADIYQFDDIQSGDFFFLCCDGVLEQLSNEDLCRILSEKKTSDKQKLDEIKAICDGKTRDNYTCWLIPIDKVKIKNAGSTSSIIQAETEQSMPITVEGQSNQIPAKEEIPKKETPKGKIISIQIPVPKIKMPSMSISRKMLKWLLLGLVILLLAGGTFYAYKAKTSPKENTEQQTAPKKKSKQKGKEKIEHSVPFVAIALNL